MRKLNLTGCLILWSSATMIAQIAFPQMDMELKQLKEQFHIPGLAALVKEEGRIIFEQYYGWADTASQVPLGRETIFPIASISKAFAAIITLQLEEEGKIKLDAPVTKYLKKSELPNSIQIQHLLSHTSEGNPGTQFNYSSRFAILTNVIEKVERKSYQQIVEERILQPFGLFNTLPGYFQDQPSALHQQIATPYYFRGTLSVGTIPEGISASSGIVSNLRDLATFDEALRYHNFLTQENQSKAFSGFTTPDEQVLPYGYGFFIQEFEGQKLVWVYGQEDCYSSLLLKVPDKDLTLILLANTSLLSDPARLINGNILKSKFALSFLRNFVFVENYSQPLIYPTFLSPSGGIDTSFFEKEKHHIYQEEALAESLAMSYFGQINDSLKTYSWTLFESLVEKAPNVLQRPDIPLLHFLMFHPYPEKEQWVKWTGQYLEFLNQALPDNPYVLYYGGEYYQILEQKEMAAKQFQRLTELQNHQPFWYTLFAHNYLGEYFKESNPKQSKVHYQAIIDVNWNIAGLVEKAKGALEQF